MKYVTPSLMIVAMSDQDVLTFSFQEEGNAPSDIIHFDDLVNRS